MIDLSAAKRAPITQLVIITPLMMATLSMMACSHNDHEVKATDRTEEAAAIARVNALEARAQELQATLATAATTQANSNATQASDTTRVKITMPDETTIPDDNRGIAIRRGLELVNHTYRELPDYVGNRLNCTSCHLNNGAQAYAAPWAGLPGIFPIYRSRDARVNSLQERINGCFQRSMNGKPLPLDSDEMNAMMAYMSWLSQDIPAGVSAEGRGFVKVDQSLKPDPERGKKLFAEKCSSCHGDNGEGQYNDDGSYLYPAIAGDDSFNDGAGMARTYKAASFVKGNMPFGQGGSLSDQEAIDISAYFTHLPRPVKANKDKDWPKGGAPKDVRR